MSAGPERHNLLLPQIERWPLDPARPVIELDDVWVAFGTKQVLQGTSLQITPGQTTVVVGRSGSGKSVLLRVMMGLQKPDRGRVTVFGRDLATCTPVEVIELRKRMGMLFQNYALFDALTVDENVGFSLHENSRLPEPEIAQLTAELIRILNLTGSERLLPAELSGGMRKRVSLARALIANPEVVLFDEPTTGLDPVSARRIDRLIRELASGLGVTAVVVSHDPPSIFGTADRVALLYQGAVHALATPGELRASPDPVVQQFITGQSSGPMETPGF
jgi:ABC-type transporter Mla maintaining outer membrane lipid asymmetry ATPase subunit MlaF